MSEKIDQFINHMLEDNYFFTEIYQEQADTDSFEIPQEVDDACKAILLEYMYLVSDDDTNEEEEYMKKNKNITPSELIKLLMQQSELFEDTELHNYIPSYPFLDLFLQCFGSNAGHNASLWSGMKNASNEVQQLGSRIIDVMIGLQGVDDIEDLCFDS